MQWLEKIDVECVHGDIFSLQAQAIACNVNIKLNLNYRLGRQLAQRCGSALSDDLLKIQQSLPDGQLALGSAITTQAYNLAPAEKLILFAWWGEHNDFTPQFIYQCLCNVLRQAMQHRVESLALPLFGSGSGSMRLEHFAAQVVHALKDFNDLKNAGEFSLRELYFASDKPQDVRFVDDYIMRRLWR